MAYPGAGHLLELKKLLYRQPKLFSEDAISCLELDKAPCKEIKTVRVTRELRLPRREALDLLAMTPYFWHAPPDIESRISQEDGLVTTAEVLLTAFRLG